jgi:hypothetical protein
MFLYMLPKFEFARLAYFNCEPTFCVSLHLTVFTCDLLFYLYPCDQLCVSALNNSWTQSCKMGFILCSFSFFLSLCSLHFHEARADEDNCTFVFGFCLFSVLTNPYTPGSDVKLLVWVTRGRVD